MGWLGFAVLCALFSGFRDFLAKRSAVTVPSHLIAFIQYLIGMPIMILAAYLTAAPGTEIPEIGPGFFPALIGATVLLSCGSLAFFRAIQLSDVSLMAPLRSLTLPCLLVIAPLLIGEQIGLGGTVGVIVLTSGLYLVSYTSGTGLAFAAYRAAAGTKYMLLAVLFYSFCALCEKVGVKNSTSLFFFACETSMGCLLIGAILLFRGQLQLKGLGPRIIATAPVGICFSLMFIAQSLALDQGPVTYVIALKRSGVIITVLLGSWILKEGATAQRLAGACIVLIGALIISSN